MICNILFFIYFAIANVVFLIFAINEEFPKWLRVIFIAACDLILMSAYVFMIMTILIGG